MLESIRNKLYKKSGLHTLLVLLFIGALICLRSFDLVALQPSSFVQKNPGKSSLVHDISHSFSHFQMPPELVPPDQVMESAEEEDELNEIKGEIAMALEEDQTLRIRLFTQVVMQRFAQKRSLLWQQAPIPYFLLYHSWKSFLI